MHDKKYSLVLFGLKHPGEAPPWGPTLYPFVYYFWQKKVPIIFRIPSIDKWCPFSVPSLELCIPFNCCKCMLYIRIDIKPVRFLGLFTPITEMQYRKIGDVYPQAPIKCICKSFQERMVLLGLFTYDLPTRRQLFVIGSISFISLILVCY